ncbi:hypothetical protein B0H16DRAFT_1773897 [Mycena metata]|uniref:Uncharacterized protein n=1 Tax=Mycena metata TaxID=1033252 RepID=A0AAD7MTV1_9AGAR|nr:hypothetical protein B0H16DRAFT_1773897 [Mycena metata]
MYRQHILLFSAAGRRRASSTTKSTTESAPSSYIPFNCDVCIVCGGLSAQGDAVLTHSDPPSCVIVASRLLLVQIATLHRPSALERDVCPRPDVIFLRRCTIFPSNAHALRTPSSTSISNATSSTTPEEFVQEGKVEGATRADKQISPRARHVAIRPHRRCGVRQRADALHLPRSEQGPDTVKCATVWIWGCQARGRDSSPSSRSRTQGLSIIHVAHWRIVSTRTTRTTGVLMCLGNTSSTRSVERSKDAVDERLGARGKSSALRPWWIADRSAHAAGARSAPSQYGLDGRCERRVRGAWDAPPRGWTSARAVWGGRYRYCPRVVLRVLVFVSDTGNASTSTGSAVTRPSSPPLHDFLPGLTFVPQLSRHRSRPVPLIPALVSRILRPRVCIYARRPWAGGRNKSALGLRIQGAPPAPISFPSPTPTLQPTVCVALSVRYVYIPTSLFLSPPPPLPLVFPAFVPRPLVPMASPAFTSPSHTRPAESSAPRGMHLPYASPARWAPAHVPRFHPHPPSPTLSPPVRRPHALPAAKSPARTVDSSAGGTQLALRGNAAHAVCVRVDSPSSPPSTLSPVPATPAPAVESSANLVSQLLIDVVSKECAA